MAGRIRLRVVRPGLVGVRSLDEACPWTVPERLGGTAIQRWGEMPDALSPPRGLG